MANRQYTIKLHKNGTSEQILPDKMWPMLDNKGYLLSLQNIFFFFFFGGGPDASIALNTGELPALPCTEVTN